MGWTCGLWGALAASLRLAACRIALYRVHGRWRKQAMGHNLLSSWVMLLWLVTLGMRRVDGWPVLGADRSRSRPWGRCWMLTVETC